MLPNPVNVGNNVTYAYGPPGAAGNAAGRITQVTSQMGTEERLYGKLGEMVFEKKTVNTFTSPLKPELYETRFAFDTFGRLLRMTYPDGEVLTYTYDSGGNLNSASGEKAVAASGQNHRYQYLHKLFYDKFEQRVLMEQGNGVKTVYTYDAQTRRLNNLTAQKNSGDQFQNLLYTYDKVGNITDLQNQVAVPPPNKFGGPTQQHFAYDSLYRLTSAFGTFQSSPQKTHRYDFAMQYDSIHNITQKTQAHVIIQPSGTSVTQKKTTYDFAYAYNPSGPTAIRPHAPNHIGERAYTYDANGNQTGWTHDQNGTRRTIVWDEENRIQSLFDNGHEKTYKYDDQRNRVIKRGPQGETVYVNQFFTSRPGATGTKHIYAGTTRIASKLMRQDVPNANPAGKTPFEKDLYFYHPDHLGTSNYITDLNGKLYEHLEYFPFGEAWVEENSNTQRTPYLFTAKELDEETGLYYFGARYYDPRTSVWQSTDPAYAGRFGSNVKKLNNQGVFRPVNLAMYTYGYLNPLAFIDPDGKDNFFIGGAGDKERFLGVMRPTGIMRDVRNANSTLFAGPNHYFGHGDAAKIIELIKKTPGKHNIIGHSWGGAAGIDITAAVGQDKIATLITLDPVSLLPKSDPENYDTWINVHQEQTFLDYIASIPIIGNLIAGFLSIFDFGGGDGDTIATLGGQLGAQSGAVNISSTAAHVDAGAMLNQAKAQMQQNQTNQQNQSQQQQQQTQGQQP